MSLVCYIRVLYSARPKKSSPTMSFNRAIEQVYSVTEDVMYSADFDETGEIVHELTLTSYDG